jgi:aminomethyltransferase
MSSGFEKGSMKRTALFEEHQRLGGRLIDFGGWELPVQYSGIMDEHLACRESVGLFDVSHMGEVHIEGADAEAYLNYLVSNQVSKLAVGQAQYTVMCHPDGGIIDDLVIYRRAQDRFLVVVNASNTEKDFNHFKAVEKEFKAPRGDLRVTNESSRYTQIAIQGRKAQEVLQKLTSANLSAIKTYWFTEGTVLGGIPAILARTGYTGEDGFEIYVEWNRGPEIWRALLEAGSPFGIKPCGLGARDTLRMEMKYPLYGNELTDQTHPLEAGLGWVVKLDKPDFIGKTALVRAKEGGLKRKLVGIKLLDKGIPRHGYPIFDSTGTRSVGEVTSGTQSPSLKAAIAIGYVEIGLSEIGQKLTLDIRGSKIPAEVTATPFYKRPY